MASYAEGDEDTGETHRREAETAHGERERPNWGAMDTRKMVTGGVGLLPWHEDRNASYRLRERP